jgi:hypothetical protein
MKLTNPGGMSRNEVIRSLFVVLGIFVLCLVIILRGTMNVRALKQQVRDLQVELAHSAVPLLVDTIRDSIPVVTQRLVEVDRTDYKKQVADAQLIKDLRLKVAQIESENAMLREIADSLQLVAVGDSLYAYHDHWADFVVDTRSGWMDYAVRDSFVTYVSRIYKHRFLWWRWGTKGYDVKHVNFNPRATVKYARTINVKD